MTYPLSIYDDYDKNATGTHLSDTMRRILNTLSDMGLASREKVTRGRDGKILYRERIPNVTPINPVVMTSQYEKYGLKVHPIILKKIKAMGDTFAYGLNISNAKVEIDGNVVYICVPRETNAILTFNEAWNVNASFEPGELLLGMDGNNQIVLNMNDSDKAHAAIIGMTGSGKSTLAQTMIYSALKIGGTKVALFSHLPKKENAFWPFAGMPRIWRGGLFSRLDDIVLGLSSLAESVNQYDREIIFAFVDDVPDLVTRRPEISKSLRILTPAGRHANIHMILLAQRLTTADTGSSIVKSNIPVRIVGKVMSPIESYDATGLGDQGCELLRGNGDFKIFTSKVTHFQAAMIPKEELERIASIYPFREPRLPARPVEPTSENTGGGRPLDDITQDQLDIIKVRWKETRKQPTTYFNAQHLNFFRKKWDRAIELAKEQLIAEGETWINP